MTAVEFIVEKLTPFNWTKEQMQEHYKDAIQQAKEMEKEHKIEFACDVYDKYNFGNQEISFREECEQFKSE
jgi:hypothetical protein